MYHVEYLTNDDYMFGKNPVNLPNIRTMSVMSGRILITDNEHHIYNLNPMHMHSLSIYHQKEKEG